MARSSEETREIVRLLRDDLYQRVAAPDGFDLRWESPTGIAVQWSDGGGGVVIAHDGSLIYATSHMTAFELEERLP